MTASIRCRRLKKLLLMVSPDDLTRQDLVMLLDLLWGLYGGGPFEMDLVADTELLHEAKAVAVSKGWCAEERGAWGAMKLRWWQP